MSEKPVRIGVLALQGAFIEHQTMLAKLGAEVTAVRTAAELAGLDGLVVPGGESTTMGLVAERSGILDELRAFCRTKPVFGSCAGMILLCDRALQMKKGGQALLGGINATVDRNHFGSQVQSFEVDLRTDVMKERGPAPGVFIRAPAIVEHGDDLEVLATLPAESRPKDTPGGECIVAARVGHYLVTSFHAELTDDTRWHELFIDMCRTARDS